MLYINKGVHRRYTIAGVTAGISDTDEMENSETKVMLLVQNEQKEGPEMKTIMKSKP